MVDSHRSSIFISDIQEHKIYTSLLSLSPTLEERLCTGSEQELFHIADMVRIASSNLTTSTLLVQINDSPPLNRYRKAHQVPGRMTQSR